MARLIIASRYFVSTVFNLPSTSLTSLCLWHNCPVGISIQRHPDLSAADGRTNSWHKVVLRTLEFPQGSVFYSKLSARSQLYLCCFSISIVPDREMKLFLLRLL